MLDSSRFIDERIPSSITSLTPVSNPVDALQPLSFIEWLKYNNSLFTNASDFLQRYQSYLNNWYEIKGNTNVNSKDLIRETYTVLIKEVILSYTSTEEKRFLKNIDVNNNRDLAIAVPFFAQKIKEICLYYSTLRDDVKSAQLRYNLKGSNYGIEKLVYNEISKSLEADDLVDFIRTLNLSLSDIRNNLVVEIEDIYDTFSNYLDVSPNLPASAYNITTGKRKEYFSENQYDIDKNLFLDFNTAIVDAISSYPFFLLELGANNFSIDVNVTSSDLNFLKDSDYTNTVNTETQENLKLNLQKAEVEKFIGTEFFYLSTGATTTDFVSGTLFTPVNDFANYLNKRYPSIAAIPSDEFINTAKEIGLFFKPDKLGLSNFTSFGTNYVIKGLSAYTVYIFPNPDKFGNISGLTNQDFVTPFTFNENSYLNKIDFSNQYSFGDSISDSYFQTFRGYESREQTNRISLQGLAKYTDPQEFFKGDQKTIWANADVYPLVPQNVFPLDNRIEHLYSLNKTQIQYKNDIFGNEYSLYKNIFPNKILSNSKSNQDNIGIKYCLVLDGHTFYDVISGYNFNYEIVDPTQNYSGVIFKTTDNIPPGSGYFTTGPNLTSVSPLSAQYYNNGIPLFALTGSPYFVISYRLQPETFCTNTVVPIYLCETFEGTTFTGPNGELLPDVCSDQPYYSAETDNLYYTDLIDAGASPTNPFYRPNFVYPPSFTFTPPYTAYNNKNGYYFLINGSEPCGLNDITRNILYSEVTPYLDYKFPYRNTQVVEQGPGLSTKKTVYEAKFIEYGELYVRNSNSTLISSASSALSAIYTKYSTEMNNELNNRLINFDVYYDVLQFETENYIIFDKIIFDYETNLPLGTSKIDTFFKRGIYENYEKLSTVWFNEKENKLFFCKTVLFNELSATNHRIIYPEIYQVDVNNLNVLKIYPTESTSRLTFDMLKQFSIAGKNINLNIVEIEKPLMTYDDETSSYTITYLGKDLSNVFYIFKIYFKYINGVITNLDNFMYKINQGVLSVNFASAQPSLYNTYNILGTSPGAVINGAFVFGA